MKTLIPVFALVLLLLLVFNQEVAAQCSMCKAVAESSVGDVAKGINSGILYLMSIPYLLLVGLGILLFRKARMSR